MTTEPIFFTPVFYVVIRWLSGRKAAGSAAPAETTTGGRMVAVEPDPTTGDQAEAPSHRSN